MMKFFTFVLENPDAFAQALVFLGLVTAAITTILERVGWVNAAKTVHATGFSLVELLRGLAGMLSTFKRRPPTGGAGLGVFALLLVVPVSGCTGLLSPSSSPSSKDVSAGIETGIEIVGGACQLAEDRIPGPFGSFVDFLCSVVPEPDHNDVSAHSMAPAEAPARTVRVRVPVSQRAAFCRANKCEGSQ